MKRLILILTAFAMAITAEARQKPHELPRVLISTDVGGTDPDDNQSVAHLLMYSNEFDLEGLVSTPSFGSGSAGEIYRMIDVYEKDLPKLNRHIKGQITVENTWNRSNDTDYKVGSRWWTDSYAEENYWSKCAGARYQRIIRDEIMEDWALRWQWLKEN
jgi:hypothetical protein